VHRCKVVFSEMGHSPASATFLTKFMAHTSHVKKFMSTVSFVQTALKPGAQEALHRLHLSGVHGPLLLVTHKQ
jgi:hypothetical protein